MSVVLATAGYDHKIRFWEAPSGICSRIIKYSDSQVNKLEITPDKQLIAAAGNPTIRLYEITSSSVLNKGGNSNNANYQNHQYGGEYDNNNNQQQNRSTSSNTIPPTQQAVLTLEGHTGNVTSLRFEKDGKYLYTGSEDGTMKIWDLRNPSCSRSFYNNNIAINSITIRYDRNEFISGDQNGNVKVWDINSGKCIDSIQPAKVASNAFQNNNNNNGNSYNNNNNNNNNSNNPHYYDNNAPNAKRKQNYSSDPYNTEGIVPIQSVDISKDSRTLVTVTNHGTVYVWDPSNSAAAAVSAAEQELNNDHNSNSTMNDNNMKQKLHSCLLRPVTKFRATNLGMYCLHSKIAPDCRHLITTSSDGTGKLWDTVTWELTKTLDHTTTNHNHNQQQSNVNQKQHNQQQQQSTTTNATTAVKRWVWDAAFCADSSYVVTACSDHVARLWNLRSGDIVRQYHGHQSAVTCVALNDSSI